MTPLRILAVVCLALVAAPAGAERPVYKSVDATGKVTYSDRQGAPGAVPVKTTRVKNWTPASPSGYAYQAAVARADSDRLYYARLLAERRLPAPVVIYDPRGWQAARLQPSYATGGTWWRLRRDPNLPDSPAPGFEPHFYYNR
ncbi:MAG TPA: DUF4124 domain-containing protein [Burkholderiales bacterium]